MIWSFKKNRNSIRVSLKIIEAVVRKLELEVLDMAPFPSPSE